MCPAPEDPMDRLKSRKFWITLAASVLVALAVQAGITEEAAWQIVALVASYIGAQGYVDAKERGNRALVGGE